MNYRLSPSDLTFLYDGCKHCFVLKVKHGIPQPSIPLPGVFTIIANLQKNHYSERRTEEFCPQLPPGIVTYGEQRVQSIPIKFDDLESTCFIAGRFDVVAELDDGSFAVLDFKTGNPSEDKVGMYGRQLHAYAFALENPVKGALKLHPISRMGLLYYTPDTCDFLGNNRQVLGGRMSWHEVKRDDAAFHRFLHEVVSLLDGPLPDPDSETCDWCSYRSEIIGVSDISTKGSNDPQSQAVVPNCPLCGDLMKRRTGKFGEFWGCVNYPSCRGTRRT
jgi:Topoisomerase DNA binding C4 zinc finger/PD-(D/E)XK nuclease superfamily